VLDLNGKTITGSDSNDSTAISVGGTANVTIKDSGTTGSIVGGNGGNGLTVTGGTVTLRGGSFQGGSGGKAITATDIAALIADGFASYDNAATPAVIADGDLAAATYIKINTAHSHTMEHHARLEATHTAPGNVEYWYCSGCDKYFSDVNGNTEITQAQTVLAVIPHSYGVQWEKDAVNHWHECSCGDKTGVAAHTYDSDTDTDCNICGYVRTVTPPAVLYTITQGAGQTIIASDNSNGQFRSNAEFVKFVKVQVDGADVAPANYSADSGSTIVTLKASYLATLSTGKHSLSIVSTDGRADTTFVIARNVTGDAGNSPQTGDNSNMLCWLAVLFVSGGALAVFCAAEKRRKHRGN
jgi:hypothetical protein